MMIPFLDSKPDLQVGDIAPDFDLPDGTGGRFHLAERLKAGLWVVLFFYPKDNTPGCTRQACAFRNVYSELRQLGADVVGISADSAESHQDFAQSQQLPFPLLIDEGGNVAKAFGVKKTLGILPGRVTFVIDPHGRIHLAFSSQLNTEAHAKEALAVLQEKGAQQ